MRVCETKLCLSVYIITFVTGFPINILAFYTFGCKVWRKPAPIDILLLNLTISDLLFLLFLPFKMQEVANDMRWDMPYFLCPLSGFVFYMTLYNSTFFLTAVSVERYLGVAFPIRHSLSRRPIYAVAASVFLWALSILHLSIVYIVPYYHPPGTGTPPRNVCYDEFTDAQLQILLPVRLELCVVLFCIPLLICSFCYISFIRILSRLPNIGRKRRLRAIGLALGTLLVFALCFGPYNVSHVVGFVTKRSPGWRDKALLLSTFNACLDPLIFYLSSAAVRSTLDSVWQGIWKRLTISFWRSLQVPGGTSKNQLPDSAAVTACCWRPVKVPEGTSKNPLPDSTALMACCWRSVKAPDGLPKNPLPNSTVMMACCWRPVKAPDGTSKTPLPKSVPVNAL